MTPTRLTRTSSTTRLARLARLTLLALLPAGLCGLGGASGGCATTRSAYYNVWEKLGYPKRERLVNNVKEARQEEDGAKQQFTSALEQFKSVANFQGGDVETMYDKLNDQYQSCESRAGNVNSKIDAVKHVATALFDEWKGEIGEMGNDPSLQQKSQELYDKTHHNYDEMIARMDAAAAKMTRVLAKFKDRVLFVKHHLNAEAIGSLKGTELELGGDVASLIHDMNASIAEADKFIEQVQSK